MYRFSKKSHDRLYTCDQRLIALFNVVILKYDCTILKGHRGKDEQNAAFMAGRSQLSWPDSDHNRYPSMAVDVAPWLQDEPHIDWNNLGPWYELSGVVKITAAKLKINVEWGGDWQNLVDMPHWGIIE